MNDLDNRIEPKIHWTKDELPKDHISAYVSLYCLKCKDMIHASNNEFMDVWVETGKGNYCIVCFSVIAHGLHDFDEREFGLIE